MRAARVAAFVCGAGFLRLAAATALGAEDKTVRLDPFTVKEERVEGFGFRAQLSFERDAGGQRRAIPVIDDVLPNTAAAKAGLQPGDRILKSDGRSMAGNGFAEQKWNDVAWKKELATRREKTVRWELGIESADRKQIRTVTLTVPTQPPRWGAAIWHPPEGRVLTVPVEEGPLAERARLILENGIWTKEENRARTLGIVSDARPFLGYGWTIRSREGKDYLEHRIFVSQQRGRIDIILSVWSSTNDRRIPTKTFLTSPAAKLEKAWGIWDERATAGKLRSEEVPRYKADAAFQRELEFWLKQVGRVSAQWPLELMPTEASPINGRR
jgi:hypothetical protein